MIGEILTKFFYMSFNDWSLDKTNLIVEEENEEKENTEEKPEKGDLKLDLKETATTGDWSNQASPDFGSVEAASPEDKQDKEAPGRTPKEDSEGWKKFQELTSGIDKVLKEKSSKLEEIKVDSYYQRKKTQVKIVIIIVIIIIIIIIIPVLHTECPVKGYATGRRTTVYQFCSLIEL